MAHANTAFVLEADSYRDATELVEEVSEESGRIGIGDYPDEPYPDLMFEGLGFKINGRSYRWRFGDEGDYGAREGLGFSLSVKLPRSKVAGLVSAM